MSTPEYEAELQAKASAVHDAASALTRAVNAAAEAGLEVELNSASKIYENGLERTIYHAEIRKVTVVRYRP